MDLSNFDFNSLDQNALDQTLAQLAPQSTCEDWNTYQIPDHDADADVQSRLPVVQGQTASPSMLQPWSGGRQQLVPPVETVSHALPSHESEYIVHPGCCSWVQCPNGTTPFSTEDNLKNHLKDHAENLVQAWSGPASCMWNGCKSKAVFKTLSQLRTHLENIHIAPLICVHPACTFKKPFRNHHDLQRHVRQKHSKDRSFRCPFQGCTQPGTSFARKDKWQAHLQEQHGDETHCPVIHCTQEQVERFAGFTSARQMTDHIFTNHVEVSLGPKLFSCRFGGCEGFQPSHFLLTMEQLNIHLRDDHDITDVPLMLIEDVLNVGRRHSVQLEDVSPWTSWSLCKRCSTPPAPKPTVPSLVVGGNLIPETMAQGNLPDVPSSLNLLNGSTLGGMKPKRAEIERFIVCCECKSPQFTRVGTRDCMSCISHRFCDDCRIDIQYQFQTGPNLENLF